MAGWVAGLAMSFWVGIGSIVTRSASATLPPPGCTANLLSHNTTAVIWTVHGNVTLRYPADSRACSVLTAVIPQINHLSLLLSRPSGLRRFYSLSYMWYSAFSCFTVVLIGLVISFLTGRWALTWSDALLSTPFLCNIETFKYVLGPMKEEDVTPGTIYPLLGNLRSCLPEHIKNKLCCVTPCGQTVRSMLTLKGELWYFSS